jgi:hypothetical protein
MPGACLGLLTPELQQWLDLPAWRESHGWDKHGTVVSMQLDFDPDRLELTMSSQEPLPKVNVLNRIDNDMFGVVTGETRAPGPFAAPGDQPVRKVDPRQISRP